ncbi:TPA: HNH endonuclease [Proteus mirabilis]|uniref:HNH endonuclease n=1 Tax=Proteus mirabilis TaxID=584 RepID=UPI001AD9FFE6|nr:HNH endonuclease [Proteus mirabilis]MBO8261860.1 HNH endonuclease [Proteus mirabilis]MBO8265450.1 HNH endonuclease [Proteus mirabilis]MBO8268283.1 HNH endonuclease [Proteus mirabilis]MBO8273204.1 HNH endonuclease [Proteus mirabilis]MBO8277345.1 HNH endonuclease [Proteus mirabilis]
MRPISRPPYSGSQVTHYKSYLPHLITAYGNYCSYCERLDKADVEHVVPTSHNADLELEWSNLILGCARCNRDFKKNKNQSRTGYVWPDQHNTYHILKYYTDGRVEPALHLTELLKQQVKNTIDLVCLDDSEQLQKPLCLGRRQTFQLAKLIKKNYLAGVQTLDEVMDCAKINFWSVWYTEFYNVPEVKIALENLLPNTDIHRQ